MMVMVGICVYLSFLFLLSVFIFILFVFGYLIVIGRIVTNKK